MYTHIRNLPVSIFLIFLMVACVSHKKQVMQLSVSDYNDLIELMNKHNSLDGVQTVEISLNCYRESDALEVYRNKISDGYSATIKNPSEKIWLVEYKKDFPFDAKKLKAEEEKFLPIVIASPSCNGPYVGIGFRQK